MSVNDEIQAINQFIELCDALAPHLLKMGYTRDFRTTNRFCTPNDKRSDLPSCVIELTPSEVQFHRFHTQVWYVDYNDPSLMGKMGYFLRTRSLEGYV